MASVEERGEQFIYIPPERTDYLLVDDPCFDLPSWKMNEDTLHDPLNTELSIVVARDHLLERLGSLGLSENPKILKAVSLTIEAHNEKFRKVSGKPYALHEMDVAYILTFVPVIGEDPDAIAGALCHDVVEDSPRDENGEKLFTVDFLREKLGGKAAGYVELLTADEPEGKAPETGTEEYYWWWRAKKQTAMNKALKNRVATILKTSDFLSNTFDFVCDRGLIDKAGNLMGNRVFDQFKVAQTSMLARITHGSIDLSFFYRDRYGENNPISLSLLTTAISLINDTLNEEQERANEKGIKWELEPLYRDWISDLRREEFILTKSRFQHR